MKISAGGLRPSRSFQRSSRRSDWGRRPGKGSGGGGGRTRFISGGHAVTVCVCVIGLCAIFREPICVYTTPRSPLRPPVISCPSLVHWIRQDHSCVKIPKDMDFSAIDKDPPHIVRGFEAKQLQGTWYKVRLLTGDVVVSPCRGAVVVVVHAAP